MREVPSRWTEEPGGPRDAQVAPAAGQIEGRDRRPLAGQFRAPVLVPGCGGIGRSVADAILAVPGEDLVGRDDQKVDPPFPAGRGEHAGRVAVATHRDFGLPGAAVDVSPGRRVDDDLRPVAAQGGGHAGGSVEVEVRPGPGHGSARPRERRVAQGGDQGRSEPAGRACDGDAHQVAVRSR